MQTESEKVKLERCVRIFIHSCVIWEIPRRTRDHLSKDRQPLERWNNPRSPTKFLLDFYQTRSS